VTERDSTADLERFLAHQGWLRALCRALVADSSAAEDVAQETWLRVLERRTHAVESPKAWLARIARRVAGERRRDAAARVARERRAAIERPELREDPDWAARVESEAVWQRRVVDAVLSLPEPARSTVVLRYFEGRSAAEIARAAGARESTVRTRLKRALDELRQKLDRESRGDRGSWLAALAPIAQRDVLDIGKGVLLMGTTAKFVAAGVVAILAAIPFFYTRAPAERPTQDAALPTTSEVSRVESEAVEERTSRSAVAADALAGLNSALSPTLDDEPAPQPLPSGVVEVQVVEHDEASGRDRPVRGGDVWIGRSGVFLPRELEADPELALRATLDESGSARFEDIPVGHHAVGVRVDDGPVIQAFVDVPSERGARTVVRLGDCSVHGVVYDFAGSPVADARVQFAGPTKLESRLHVVVWTDSEGRYRIGHLPAGAFGAGVDLSGVQNPQGGEYMTMLTLSGAREFEHDFGARAGLPLWRGVVRTRAGERVLQETLSGRGGRIHALRESPWNYRYVDWTDDGSFELRLEPGEYEIKLSMPGRDEREVVLERLVVDADAARPGFTLLQDLQAPGATVWGFVGSGRWISLRRDSTERPVVALLRPADGRYRIDGVLPGRWRLVSDERWIEFTVDERDERVAVDLP